VVQPLGLALDFGATALDQANSDSAAEEFARDGDPRRTRLNNTQIGVDDLVGREFSCVLEHRK
jgi:hypothetical protein